MLSNKTFAGQLTNIYTFLVCESFTNSFPLYSFLSILTVQLYVAELFLAHPYII